MGEGGGLRDAALRILRASLAAVDADGAVVRQLSRDPLDGAVVVLGAGKAAARMAAAAERCLGDRVCGGLVVVKDGHGQSLQRVRLLEAAHPVPDERSMRAGEAISGALSDAPEGATVLFLLSGGASALMERLPPGLTLSDLQSVTRDLLRSGATIQEVNTVRRHLSLLKGGGLARLAGGRPVVVYALSDVLGDELQAIGSGPFAPDRTTAADAAGVLARYGLSRQASHLVETPAPDDACFRSVRTEIVGSVADLARAAAEEAAACGFPPLLVTTSLEGEAREVARVLCAIGRDVRLRRNGIPAPACVLAGGETTVTVRGTGRGGRNQEMALSAAQALDGTDGVLFMAVSSDGTDGPTDAAGGFADGTSAARGRARGLSPTACLDDNDSYAWLSATGDLIRTGPTLTNVNDLCLILIQAP